MHCNVYVVFCGQAVTDSDNETSFSEEVLNFFEDNPYILHDLEGDYIYEESAKKVSFMGSAWYSLSHRVGRED